MVGYSFVRVEYSDLLTNLAIIPTLVDKLHHTYISQNKFENKTSLSMDVY